MCGDFYIGETGRSATPDERTQSNLQMGQIRKVSSGTVAEHAWKDGHIIEWDEVKILDTPRDERERRVKEALYIKLAPPGLRMNRDEGK